MPRSPEGRDGVAPASPWAAFWGLVLEEAAALRRREERQAEADGAEDADK